MLVASTASILTCCKVACQSFLASQNTRQENKKGCSFPGTERSRNEKVLIFRMSGTECSKWLRTAVV
jgi:hypothetical protein